MSQDNPMGKVEGMNPGDERPVESEIPFESYFDKEADRMNDDAFYNEDDNRAGLTDADNLLLHPPPATKTIERSSGNYPYDDWKRAYDGLKAAIEKDRSTAGHRPWPERNYMLAGRVRTLSKELKL